LIELFPDQAELIESVATEMRAGTRAILMQAATGSGKSIMAAEILRRARAKNKTVLFTVPRRELLKQMGRTFNNFDITHSYIAAGMSFNPHSLAHISSTDTLRRRLDSLRAPDLAVIDETHFGSNGLDEIIKWLKKSGSYIIGLSATPWKLSGQGLGCWYDKMICGRDIRWLIDNGRLSDYRAFLAPRLDLSQIETVGGDYNKAKLGDRMRLIIGDAVKHYRQHAYGKLNITYCVSIDESKRTAAAFNDAGIPTAHLDGETSDEEKTRIIRAYANY
jgi:superfamily II DNA or RNA helicase